MHVEGQTASSSVVPCRSFPEGPKAQAVCATASAAGRAQRWTETWKSWPACSAAEVAEKPLTAWALLW